MAISYKLQKSRTEDMREETPEQKTIWRTNANWGFKNTEVLKEMAKEMVQDTAKMDQRKDRGSKTGNK